MCPLTLKRQVSDGIINDPRLCKYVCFFSKFPRRSTLLSASPSLQLPPRHSDLPPEPRPIDLPEPGPDHRTAAHLRGLLRRRRVRVWRVQPRRRGRVLFDVLSGEPQPAPDRLAGVHGIEVRTEDRHESLSTDAVNSDTDWTIDQYNSSVYKIADKINPGNANVS